MKPVFFVLSHFSNLSFCLIVYFSLPPIVPPLVLFIFEVCLIITSKKMLFIIKAKKQHGQYVDMQEIYNGEKDSVIFMIALYSQ